MVLKELNFDPESSIHKQYFLGTPNHLFLLEINLDLQNAITTSIAFEYRTFYYGFALRVGSNHIINFGGQFRII